MCVCVIVKHSGVPPCVVDGLYRYHVFIILVLSWLIMATVYWQSREKEDCATGSASASASLVGEIALGTMAQVRHHAARCVCWCSGSMVVWWENEWMNKLYFTRVVEKTRGLFTSSPRPWGKLLFTKDTVSSMLSTCTLLLLLLIAFI